MAKIADKIPKAGKELVKYKGSELVEKLGHATISNVVISILTGGNVRAVTEKLTQTRVSLGNAAMITTFANIFNDGIENDNLYELIREELDQSVLEVEEKTYLLWILGLTGKSVQNVLRSDKTNMAAYISNLNETIDSTAHNSHKKFGKLSGKLTVKRTNFPIDWKTWLQVSLATATQTLAMRGDEKSTYGKFFEKLILGSLLSFLGFEMIDKNDISKNTKVFWLSERNEKRESDATLLFKPGKGIRFDIGFIGSGNTEISLDKVTRFENEMKRAGQEHKMKTIILVDMIGEGSRIVQMAKEINGHIIQMSGNYWVLEVAFVLKDFVGFTHPILKLTPEASISYIRDEVNKIDMNNIITGITATEK